MLLCIPCTDGHDSTKRTLESIQKTTEGRVEVLIFDNASEKPYRQPVLRSEKNLGYYAPLRDAYRYDTQASTQHELIGLCHNDVVFYEYGWDLRLVEVFKSDLKLGLVGMCGSNEADHLGGRGGGTMCFFRGDIGHSQAAGRRVHGLHPAILLDSLFMMFRTPAIEALDEGEDWDNLPLAHFYDKIWPCRLAERGWRTAVLGSEIDHVGGATIMGNNAYTEACKQWFKDRPHEPAPAANAETAMYLMAERRFLDEFRDKKKFIPCRIDDGYRIHKR